MLHFVVVSPRKEKKKKKKRNINNNLANLPSHDMSPEFFLPPILPGPVSRSVVGEWLSGHEWWIWSTELTCLCERLGTVLGSEVAS